MGIAFINQQYLQNVLGYDTLQAGAAILPAVVFMVVVAPRSAKLVHDGARGSRCCSARPSWAWRFIDMFFLWGEGTPYWIVAIPLYASMGIGVGPRGHTVLQFAHRVRARHAGGHGVGDGGSSSATWAARS